MFIQLLVAVVIGDQQDRSTSATISMHRYARCAGTAFRPQGAPATIVAAHVVYAGAEKSGCSSW